MNDKAYLSIRMNKPLHDKFRYAAYEGRSMSGQVMDLVNKYVRDFEKENGSIDPTDYDWN